MIVIGLVGEKRAGKETFLNLFREELPGANILQVRFSDIIGDILDILGMPKTRENMQKLPIALIKEFGDQEIITKAMKLRIMRLSADIIILDGIRLPSDAKLLKTFEKNFLIYITASPEIRYERAKKNSDKADEKNMTFDQFLEKDNAEIERQIPIIGESADYVIQNDYTLGCYRRKVKLFTLGYISTAP